MRYVIIVVMLTAVYALALASIHPWDLALGAVLASVLLFAARGFVFAIDRTDAAERRPPMPVRMLWFVPFAAIVTREIVSGTLEVALTTLHLRPLRRPGIVAVPLGERTPAGIAVWAITTGLTPGAFFVDVDRRRGVALIHLLDASDPEGFRAQEKRFYRRYQSKVFP